MIVLIVVFACCSYSLAFTAHPSVQQHRQLPWPSSLLQKNERQQTQSFPFIEFHHPSRSFQLSLTRNSLRFQRRNGVDKKPIKNSSSSSVLLNAENDNNINQKESKEDLFFQGKTTISLIAGQGLLIVAAVVAAVILQIPNFGLGSTFILELPQIQASIVATLPLALVAYVLDWIEPQVPWLQDVTMATQRSILALLGGTWKPALAIGVSILLSLAAGIGEEILFRGVLQYELISRWHDVTAGLVVSSVFFGALHAVTPLYAIMATLASLYFGWLFLHFDNLAIPIVTHTFYDFGAILYAHYTISHMTPAQLDTVYNWQGPGTRKTTSNDK